MSLVVSIEYPPCHRAKSSPQQWDADFESLYRRKTALTTAKGYFESRLFEERHVPASRREGNLLEYAELSQQLRGLQRTVAAQAASFLTHEDLAAKWLGASVKVRAKHALIGIAGACAISPNLNHARLSCTKELRVKYLSEDGQVLLDLLNAIAPADLSEIPAEVQYINNSEWDEVRAAHQDNQDEVEKLTLSYILVLRTKLITHVLQFIIHSFLGHELPKIPVYKKGHTQDKSAVPNALADVQKKIKLAKYGKEGYKAIAAEFKAAYKERTANKVYACHGCGKKSEKRETYKRCVSCWKINREVLYCSRDCQVANWKLEHKLYCGKPLNFDTVAMLATIVPKAKNPFGFPPPEPGFKRPLELLKQMELLKERPEFDYAVKRSVYTNNEGTALMFYKDPAAKARFRAHRERAVTTGNHYSVAMMCEYILWDIEVRKAADFCREKVVEQISREYAFPVAELEEHLEVLGTIRAKYGIPALAYFDMEKANMMEADE